MADTFDPHTRRAGYLPGSDYGLPHLSVFSRAYASQAAVLRHASCSYVSTPGVLPTLAVLKQHAQSLCALIGLLEPGLPGPDWLDLATPYSSSDPIENRPLRALANEVAAHHDVLGPTYRCPLATAPSGRDAYQRSGPETRDPVSHHSLLMHANMCLERLDHELAASGGLLAALPTGTVGQKGGQEGPKEGNPERSENQKEDQKEDPSEEEEDEERRARNSLVGQWLGFTQQLVGRMHELEIAYGNAVTLLAGEAMVPAEVVGAQAVPERMALAAGLVGQDRWLLANAGNDAWEAVHALLDRRAQVADAQTAAWRAAGVQGSGAGALSQQLLHVDVTTRYYRVDNSPDTSRGPVFICPVWSVHPGIQPAAADAEKRPTVVFQRGGAGPDGSGGGGGGGGRTVTALERRYDERLREAARIEQTCQRLAQERDEAVSEVQALKREKNVLLAEVEELEADARDRQLLTEQAEREERDRA